MPANNKPYDPYEGQDPYKEEEEFFKKQRTGFAKLNASHFVNVTPRERHCLANKIYWSFYDPFKSDRYQKRFDELPVLISRDVEKMIRESLDSNSIEKLEAFRRGESAPFLVIRKILPVPVGFPIDEYAYSRSAGNRFEKVTTRARRRMRMIDSVLGGLLYLVGAEPAPRFPEKSKRCGYNLTTRWDVQETFDSAGPDMPLRFHQGTIERPLPEDFPKRGDTALYVIFGSIRNPRRLPILLLPIDTILNALNERIKDEETLETVMKTLKGKNFSKEIGRLKRHVMFGKAKDNAGHRILSKYRGQSIMGFDSSLMWVTEEHNADGLRAIDELRHAIEEASWEKSYEIKLCRHDVLIVDNLRAMVARCEDEPSFLEMGAFFRRGRRRWLRKMYGLPREYTAK